MRDGIIPANLYNSGRLGGSEATDYELGNPEVPEMDQSASKASGGRNLCTVVGENTFVLKSFYSIVITCSFFPCRCENFPKSDLAMDAFG